MYFAKVLRAHGVQVRIHDPYVYATDANLKQFGMTDVFTRELSEAVRDAEVIVLCCPHRVYAEQWKAIAAMAPKAKQVVDANPVDFPSPSSDTLHTPSPSEKKP